MILRRLSEEAERLGGGIYRRPVRLGAAIAWSPQDSDREMNMIELGKLKIPRAVRRQSDARGAGIEWLHNKYCTSGNAVTCNYIYSSLDARPGTIGTR
jgi:hypothetical protein